VLHEQNSVAGLTNKVLAGVADRVLRVSRGAGQGAVGGNPVRAEFLRSPPPAQRYAGAAARCGCWWWAAAWARRRSTRSCRRRWR
jgi:UDP-N-acetylglucosamine:LPS N-acetylglucosamine transferase